MTRMRDVQAPFRGPSLLVRADALALSPSCWRNHTFSDSGEQDLRFPGLQDEIRLIKTNFLGPDIHREICCAGDQPGNFAQGSIGPEFADQVEAAAVPHVNVCAKDR